MLSWRDLMFIKYPKVSFSIVETLVVCLVMPLFVFTAYNLCLIGSFDYKIPHEFIPYFYELIAVYDELIQETYILSLFILILPLNLN